MKDKDYEVLRQAIIDLQKRVTVLERQTAAKVRVTRSPYDLSARDRR